LLDAKLLAAAISSRAAWERIAPYFSEADFSPVSKFWYALVKEWYGRDPQATAVDRSLLIEQGLKRLTNKKHHEAMAGFMQELPEPPSPDNVAQVALEMKRYTVSMSLGAALASQDDKKIAELLPQFNELRTATELRSKEVATDVEVASDWAQLDEHVGKGKRIALAPQKLTDRTNGGGLPGHAILIIGRSDAGKSTFTLNMTGGFVKQKKRTLYLGNEENINVLKARMRNHLAHMTPEEVEAAPAKANELAKKRAGDLLHMIHLHKASMDDVYKQARIYEPEVVVLDQIRGMSVSNGEKMTQRLEQVGIEWRQFLAQGYLGIAVTQANDRTERYGQEPPIILSQSDVDSSRTGLPGASDAIFGVGVNEELRQRGQRMISIAKSKLSAAPDAKEPFLVEMDTARCKVRS
jgi:archaellum biogenesis ATPase FlaH